MLGRTAGRGGGQVAEPGVTAGRCGGGACRGISIEQLGGTAPITKATPGS